MYEIFQLVVSLAEGVEASSVLLWAVAEGAALPRKSIISARTVDMNGSELSLVPEYSQKSQGKILSSISTN